MAFHVATSEVFKLHKFAEPQAYELEYCNPNRMGTEESYENLIKESWPVPNML